MSVRFNLFYTLKALGRSEEALLHGEFIFAKNMPYPDFYCAMGEVYLALSMFDEAARSIQKTLDMNPQYGKAHFLLAQIYEKHGKIRQALEELEKCAECKPPKALQAMIREALNRLQPQN